MNPRQKALADPVGFILSLYIFVNEGVRRFGDVADQWQIQLLRSMERALIALADPKAPAADVRNFLNELGRGHGKTMLVAMVIVWLLVVCPRKVLIVVAAADKDQAALIRDACDMLARHNLLVSSLLEVQRDRVVNQNTGSEAVILSSDAPTSYGRTPDLIIVDELSHWKASGEALWHSLASSSVKRERCVMVIITNAGTGRGTSWQWTVREAARESDDWYFFSAPGPIASWISPERLEQLRRILPPIVYRRLIDNEWTTGEEGALSERDVRKCIVLPGPHPGYMSEHSPYVLAFDLGRSRDHCAAVVLGPDYFTGRLQLAWCGSWKPPRPGIPIDLNAVFLELSQVANKFRIEGGICDPHEGGEMLAQRLLAETCLRVCYRASFGSAAYRQEIAEGLVSAFVNEEIALYEEPDLVGDLLRIQIAESVAGISLKSKRDEAGGHCDRGIALAMCLPFAERWIAASRVRHEPDEVIYT